MVVDLKSMVLTVSMSGTYDHDNDPSTTNIAIPGAIEVNDDSGNVLLTATFSVDSRIETNQIGTLSFFGGVRGGNSTAASVGDDIQIRWTGGGSNSANGQEVALVSFSTVDVPEPSTLAIFALGVFGLASRKLKN
jgi:hypothetical protein